MPTLTPHKAQGTTSITIIAGWSSLAARKAHNLEVPGSNPGPATTQGGSMGLLFFRSRSGFTDAPALKGLGLGWTSRLLGVNSMKSNRPV